MTQFDEMKYVGLGWYVECLIDSKKKHYHGALISDQSRLATFTNQGH